MLTRNKASGIMVADLGKDLRVLFDHLLEGLAIRLVNRFIVLPEFTVAEVRALASFRRSSVLTGTGSLAAFPSSQPEAVSGSVRDQKARPPAHPVRSLLPPSLSSSSSSPLFLHS